ncbi:MAG: sigma-54-dependent Fis family transcriptional regulator [Acidobacteria bacterium]|nr:MAG: sigma-54-dependent Fis family transcriptional regulator [Acidobacteriota bacterium]
MNPAHKYRVLVADDQPDVRDALCLLLKSEGFEAQAVASPAAALEAIERRDFDAALIDLNYTRDTTSGTEGLDLLSRIQALDSSLPAIVMTAWGSVSLAVEAMRRGARDFIEKPWDNARMLAILKTQIELGHALRKSSRLEPVKELIARVGPSDANVLITGEHGTGKEVVARTLHQVSPRAARTLVAVNAGGLAEGVFESELFGHVKGAFTDARVDRVGRFELADGGTLFLDEIANVPLNLQAKLLRVLETGEIERVGASKPRHVSVRVISATNVDPAAEVTAGRFREDLLFRLNTIEIHLPPLRERKMDIPILAMHFLAQYHDRYRRPVSNFDDAALVALVEHTWPGNVRELDHTVERAVLLAEGPVIRPSNLGLRASRDGNLRLEEMGLDDVERFLIQKAMARYSGNISHAAKALGLSRSGLYRRIKKFGL